MARDAGAPQRLLDLDDIELLRELGLLTPSGLAREALLLAGSEDGLNRYFPEYRWKYDSSAKTIGAILSEYPPR